MWCLRMDLKSAPARKKAVKERVNALNAWNITNKRSAKLIAKEKPLQNL